MCVQMNPLLNTSSSLRQEQDAHRLTSVKNGDYPALCSECLCLSKLIYLGSWGDGSVGKILAT